MENNSHIRFFYVIVKLRCDNDRNKIASHLSTCYSIIFIDYVIIAKGSLTLKRPIAVISPKLLAGLILA